VLADAIAAIAPARVAIDGRTGAGKSTLADELGERLRGAGLEVVRVSVDDFHRPPAERHARGRESPEGYYHDTFDLAALRAAVLAPARVVALVDGIFLLRPELVDLWDLRIWIAIDETESLRRGLARDAAPMGGEIAARRLYERRYLPGEALYLEDARPHESADFVLDNADPARPRLTGRSRL
jgi:uridine kinase